MIRTAALFALAVVLGGASFACVSERTYTDVDSGGDMAWQGLGGGIASLRGDVGELPAIDNTARDMWVTRETNVLELSGNVPHQAQAGSSVWLDIRIVNGDQLSIGEELRQDEVIDTYETDSIQGPALDVYVCPNGEGVSGNADDIVVTRTGPETFTFAARSTDTAQNLDIDLDLAAE